MQAPECVRVLIPKHFCSQHYIFFEQWFCKLVTGLFLQEGCQIVESVRRVHARLREFLGEVTLAEIAFYRAPIVLNVESGTLN